MDIRIIKIKQYNATYKHILMIDQNPVAIFASERRAAEAIKYVEGYDADFNDGAIKKRLEPFKKAPNGIQTEKKKKRKQKAIHQFTKSEKSKEDLSQ